MLKINAVKKLRDFELDIDISVPKCGTVVLMGNNGSGKTTVLNLLSGIISPDSGHIEALGKVFYDSGGDIDVPPEKRNIGYVFQNYALFPHMTVFDNVAFGLRMRKLPGLEVEDRIKARLQAVDMWHLKDENVMKLSGGQKQRVALSRALAVEPDLLIMDEPLNALDVQTRKAMREELKAIIKKLRAPCIIVTHSPRDALELGDLVYILSSGKVVTSGEPESLLKKVGNGFIDEYLD